MEKFFLGALFALEELNIVDQEHVDLAVEAAELIEGVLADGFEELVGKFLAGEINDVGVGVVCPDGVGHGVHEVRLSETGVAVEEEGVVGLAGFTGHGRGGGVRELVARSDDEIIKGIARVEVGEGPVVARARLRAQAVGSRSRAVHRGGGFVMGRRIRQRLAGGADDHVETFTAAAGDFLPNKVEVVIFQPNCGKLVGRFHDEGILAVHARTQRGKPIVVGFPARKFFRTPPGPLSRAES